MAYSIPFTKMHGAGNDYVYVDTILHPVKNPEALSVRWSAPHTGIGADGLVLIGASGAADFNMRIFNSDGSEAQMCGNAAMCIGKYVYEKGLTDKKTLTLETLSGIKELQLSVADDGKVKEVTVDMGVPVVGETALRLEAGGEFYTGTVVSMGNPHFVIFTEDLSRINLPAVGALLERHPFFPHRTNVEFVQVKHPNEIKMRVWERGSGITLACGTGACASAVASFANGITARKVKVAMDGGTRHIFWDEASRKVFMTGSATHVFEGSIEIS